MVFIVGIKKGKARVVNAGIHFASKERNVIKTPLKLNMLIRPI